MCIRDSRLAAQPEFADLAVRQFPAVRRVGDPDLQCGGGAADAVGVFQVAGAEVGDHAAGGLGEAVPVAGFDPAVEAAGYPAGQFGGRGGAAGADHCQAGQRVGCGVGRVQQAERGGRDADVHGDAVFGDQPECGRRVPLAHQDGGAAARHQAEQRRERGDVEEREGHQRGVPGGLRQVAAGGEHRDGGVVAGVRGRRAPGGVGGDNSLGVTGGSGGVEQGGVVVRADRELGCGERGVGAQVLEAVVVVRVADGEQRGAVRGDPVGHPLGPLRVGHDQAGCAVVERVRQFLRLPPGVQRHGDQTGQLGGPEGDLPLGEVPHRDHHPVAGPQAVGVPIAVGEGDGGRVVPGEGVAAGLGHQEGAVAVCTGGLQQLPQGARAVAVAGAGGGGLDLEGHARGAQGGLDAGDQGEGVGRLRCDCHDVLGCGG